MLMFYTITDNKKPNVGTTQAKSLKNVLPCPHSAMEIKLASEYCFTEGQSPKKGQMHYPTAYSSFKMGMLP